MYARTTTALVSAALAWLAAAGCGDSTDPREYAKQVAAEQRQPRPESKVVKIQTAVPPGKKVACDAWVDLAVMTTETGQEEPLVLEDRSASERDATSICALRRAGEPPDEKAQAKKWEKEGMKLGVLPGDELCLVHVYCAYVNDDEQLKAKCAKDPSQSTNGVLGPIACVRQSQRASDWAYKYTLIDPDSTCTLEVQGGPSVTDEAVVQACARGALASLTPAGVANYK